MAANNYFGFTHGGTQYGTPGPGAAYGGQTGYAVAPAATAATYGTQRAAATGYDPAYQAAAATQGSYAAAHAAAQHAAAAQYDASKTYYQQAAAAYSAPPAPAYDAKPAYTTQTAYAPQTGARQAVKTTYGTAYSAATPAPTSYSAQTYSTNTVQTQAKPAQAARTYSNYDTALYNAASMYVASQKVGGNQGNAGGGGWKSYKQAGNNQQRRPKPPPKAQTLHYCDVCRISCAGPQTYREHLEGQKHKKKEAAVKAGTTTQPVTGGRASLRCELCDVTCTGADAYAAHVRGIKHQKVVKLHTMLGKPIPEPEQPKAAKTVAGTAKVPFVAAGGLATVSGTDTKVSTEANNIVEDGSGEEEVQPVGQDYIEEVRGDDGKTVSFNCKLCECRFNDPNAKEMHMKGRRHRLQYKKKVQPDLVVDVKPSLKQRKLAEQKAQRMMMREELWARRRMEAGMGPFPPMRRPETPDDRHVMAKHAEIYPTEEELQNIQRIVSHTEKALKSLSDFLADGKTTTNGKATNAVTVKKEVDKGEKDDKGENKEDGRDNQLFSFAREGEAGTTSGGKAPRSLKGVMRVDALAKGLLLRGDKHVRLVLLTQDRPTVSLLKLLHTHLPSHLQNASGDDHKYKVELMPAEGAVQVSDGKIFVMVSLTSPLMREPAVNPAEEADVLPRQKCLDALAALRHAKWFQARAANMQSCVIIIRILKDLCRRIPTWAPLKPWAMELLVAGVLSSAGSPLSPGEALRRVMEAIAGGILLEHGPGLLDPCEKDTQDALGPLAAQRREDLTASAQQYLRQIAFRQVHKVLEMEPLPVVKRTGSAPWKFGRKRRRSQTDAEGEGKVVKKEEAMDTDDSPAK